MISPQRILIGIFVLLLMAISFTIPKPVQADDKVNLYLFWGDGCPHCTTEKEFLTNLQKEIPELVIQSYEVWYDRENAQLFEEFAKAYNIRVDGVPTTFIGNNPPISGFGSAATTGATIRNYINECLENTCIDPMAKVKGTATPDSDKTQNQIVSATDELLVREKVALPLLGEVDPGQLGIIGFTILVGALDGFNACAMWVLCFLLSLLVYSKSRKRIFVIGGTFIFVSGLMYYVFIAGWMNFFMFAGSLRAIQLATGLFAVVFGLVAIKDFFWLGKWFSFAIPKQAKPGIIKRMNIVTRGTSSLVAAMVGAAVLAFGVNLVELLCSIGLPTIYTSVLTSYGFSAGTNYALLALYILFYMIDDLLIFTIVVLTMSSKQFTEKYARTSKLISGLVILIIGLIMIISPKLLTF